MYHACHEIDLADSRRKLALGAACLVLAGMYSFSAVRVLRAHRSAESLTPAGLERAATLEPGNASHWSRLGRYKFFLQQDVPGSLPMYETATKLDPYSARYWLDLAAADAVMGRSSDQEHALQAAVAADPKSPQVAWEASNFYLIRGEMPAALQNLRVVTEGDPAMRLQALRLAWRIFHDPSLLLEKAVPPEPAAYWDLLQVTMEFNNLQAANTVWNAILKLHQPFPRAGCISLGQRSSQLRKRRPRTAGLERSVEV